MNKQPKFLVIRFSSIGDILLTTPLLRTLRHRFPHSDIGVAVKEQFASLLQYNSHIDRLHCLNKRGSIADLRQLKSEIRDIGYDTIIDIHDNMRSRYLKHGLCKMHFQYKKYKCKRFWLVHTRLNFYQDIIPVHLRYINSISTLGVQDDGAGLELNVPQSIQQQMKDRLMQMGFKKNSLSIGIAAGAGFPTKRWPAEYYHNVCQRLQDEHHAQIVLFGDPSDRDTAQLIRKGLHGPVFDLTGSCSLLETAAAMQTCHLLLCNDTGLMHMATTLPMQVVAVFGCTTRELGFFPVGKQSTVIEHHQLSCRPCTHMGRRKCPKGHFKCMLDIHPDTVYRAVLKQLETNGSVKTPI